jgi:hypothetical protein
MVTDTWLAHTGDWTTAGDWDSGVPTSSSEVSIDSIARVGTATSSGDVVINTLQIRQGDILDLTGGNFNVTNGLPFGMFGFIDVDSANFQIDGGTINNSATIELSPSGINTTDLTIADTVQLNGAGSIVFAGNGNDGILGGNPSATLTNFDNNISGSGFIEGLVFINHSTIETNNDLGAGTLRIVGSAYGGSFDNENSLFADNGGTIVLGDWAGLGRSSTIINNNTIEALSDGSATNIEIAGNVTIQGSGQILFGGSRPDDDVIVSNGLSATLNLDGGTLSGAGNLGDAHLTLNIEAGTTVKATGPFFDINTGANTVTNAGLIIVSADGGLSIQSAVQNTGTVLATSPDGSLSFVAQGNTNGPTGVILALGGNIGLFGSITNNGGLIQVGNGGEIIVTSDILGLNGGQIEIGSGGLLDLRPFGTVSQGVKFTGAGGTLELDQDAGQIGTDISGLTVADSIDLGFLSFATGDHTVWTQTGGGEGTITVEAANGSLLDTLVVEGTWNSQDFTVTPDSNNAVEVTVKSPSPSPSISADLIMHNGGGGLYELYDLGNNAIVSATSLPLLGPEWQVAGLGGFFGSDTSDMLMRNDSTGAFEVYDISNNNITNAVAMGQVGLEWAVAGFGDFSGNPGETDMLMRDSNNGQFEVYDISNNAITAAAPMGQVGLEWQVAGFGDFSTLPNESDMLMRNTNTGTFELYDIRNNTIASAAPMGQVGLEWSVAGFGDFSGNANETDMLMRNNNTGAFEIYDIRNNMIASAAPMGQVGLEWQVAGFGPINGAGTSDMLMRNTNTGAFELYDISNNQITNATSMGQVGNEWSVAGIATDPPSAAPANAQLAQAMASTGTSAPVGAGNTAQLGAETSAQTLLTIPQAG